MLFSPIYRFHPAHPKCTEAGSSGEKDVWPYRSISGSFSKSLSFAPMAC